MGKRVKLLAKALEKSAPLPTRGGWYCWESYYIVPAHPQVVFTTITSSSGTGNRQHETMRITFNSEGV